MCATAGAHPRQRGAAPSQLAHLQQKQKRQQEQEQERGDLGGRARPVQVPRRTRLHVRDEAARTRSQELSVLDERSRLWLWL